MRQTYCNLRAILVLLLCSTATVVFSEEFSRGLLWKVSSQQTQPSYIFGTVHTDLPDYTQIPPIVLQALKKSRSFSAELDMTDKTLKQAGRLMLLPENQQLVNLIGLERYEQCVRMMAGRGVSEPYVSAMKPWVLATQLSLPVLTNGLFMDLKLYQEAVSSGLKTYGLETAEEQMNVFDMLTLEQQIKLLDDAMARHKDLSETTQTLLGFYKNRDIGAMQRYSNSFLVDGDKQLTKRVRKSLIDDRNQRMVNRIENRLKEGEAFIAVGSLHLPGKKGILQLLQDRGYRISVVY